MPADNRPARPKAKDSQASDALTPKPPAPSADTGNGKPAPASPPVTPPDAPSAPATTPSVGRAPWESTVSDVKPPERAPWETAAPDIKQADRAASPLTVSPAAFAWDMPQPPPESPASPARAFLRSDSRPSKPKREPNPPAPAAAAKAPAPAVSSEPPAAPRSQPTAPKRSVRQAHLTVSRVEPWSVMKFSFVVSLVAFVILFVAVSVLYGVLSGIGVFDSLQRVVNSVTSSQTSTGVNARAWFSASRVLGYTALLGSLNIVLITAMSTIGSVVYNLTSRLVGGVEVTLRETE
jgi:hypothetical protein